MKKKSLIERVLPFRALTFSNLYQPIFIHVGVGVQTREEKYFFLSMIDRDNLVSPRRVEEIQCHTSVQLAIREMAFGASDLLHDSSNIKISLDYSSLFISTFTFIYKIIIRTV